MPKNFCPACYPKKTRSHWDSYFSDWLDFITQDFLFSRRPVPQLPRFPYWFSATHFWYTLMSWLGLIRFTNHFEKKDHYPRSWVVIEEAQRRGLHLQNILIWGRPTTYYRVCFGRRYYYFDAVPSRFLNFHLDDKYFVKKNLLKQGFPAPAGRLFWNIKHAVSYGKKLGFPLAVKPARGTHAYHVSAPVTSEEELEKAARLAKQYQPRFIVERFLQQHLYRITVINFNQVFAACRESPNVIGDGKSTIKELVEKKNLDPRRGQPGQKDATLHQIPFNKKTEAALGRQGLTWNFAPQENQKIILHNKVSIGSGGDIIEETFLLHPENKEMFRRAARIFGADLVGFDFVAEDISRPYVEQECGIIEANSVPMIDFHHNPSIGEAQDAAGALWDEILADKRVKYLARAGHVHQAFFYRMMWHFLEVVMPIVRDLLLRLRLVRIMERRQPFPIGYLKSEVSPETVIYYLKIHGFEVDHPGWLDRGEIAGLRKLAQEGRQYHVRIFNDREVRAHLEYAPEYRPFAHLLGQGLEAAHDNIKQLLEKYLER